MNEENRQRLSELFSRYGYSCDDGKIYICDYVLRADTLNNVARVRSADKTAERLIRECEEAIATLRAYRQTLAERYSYLETAPTVSVVRLRRATGYKITYHLTVLRRRVDDGTETEENATHYPGTERHKAIAAFRAYVKAHPGIIAEMDIEKNRWEK